MSAEKGKFIAVTHFINPQLFWYHEVDAANEDFHEIMQLEKEMQDYYAKPASFYNYSPEVDDFVAVRFLAWNRMIRAQVRSIVNCTNREYIVWALDYGFPFQTKEHYVRRLPSSFRKHIDHIQCGGLSDVLAAEMEFDFIEMRLRMMTTDKWNQRSCDTLEKLLADAASITFVEDFQANGQVWGDLVIVNHTGSKFHGRNFLIDINSAIEAGAQFKSMCGKLQANKILPWLSNNGNTKYKMNTVTSVMGEHNKQKNSVLTEACDDLAKRKVEDWCARNELAASNMALETYETNADTDGIEDISFNDSVSFSKYQHQKGRTKNYVFGDDATNIQCMGLAGIVTKNKMEKYVGGHMPPEPKRQSLQINPMEKSPNAASTVKSNVSEHILETESEFGVALNDFSSGTSVSGMSNRRQKLIEIKKKVAKQRTEQMKQEHTQISATSEENSHTTTIKYEIMEESSCNSTKADDNANEKCAVSSTPSERTKQLIALRRKHNPTNTVDSNLAESKLISPTNTLSVNPIVSPPSKYLENIRKMKQCHLKKREKSDEDAKSITSTGSNSRVENLINFKKQLKAKTLNGKDHNEECETLDEKFSHLSTQDSSANFEFPDMTLNTRATKKYDGFSSINMVPAGFDLANLNKYNDKNHWHLRKTTRHDHVPHDNSTLDTTAGESFNVSPNIESLSDTWFGNSSIETKYPSKSHKLVQPNAATRPKNNREEERNILDLTVPDLSDKPLECSAKKIGNVAVMSPLRKEKISPHNESQTDSSSPTLATAMHGKRRLSRDQIVNQILRRANFEKQMDNENLIDLENTKPVSTESKNEDHFFGNVASDENKMKTSNKSALILNRSKGIGDESNAPITPKVIDENKQSFTITRPMAPELREIDGEKRLQTKFIEHLVLAHSKQHLQPLGSAEDAYFLKEIHEELNNMRITKVYRIQAYSWPHMLRSNSYVVVNPAKSGKTWSYLPPICSLVGFRVKNGPLPETYGPVAIILVSSAPSVEMVSGFCRRLLIRAQPKVSVVSSFGVRNAKEVKIQLLNGCGILVATPASLFRLLQDREHESFFNSERLHHIVIDDMDIMLSRSSVDFRAVIKMLFKLCKQPKNCILPIQLVVTSRDWDPIMVPLIRCSTQPLLLIGDFLEAAVYGKASISIKLQPRQCKIEAILSFIKEHPLEQEHLVIFCNDDEDVTHVAHALTANSYICMAYNSQSSTSVLVTIEEWKKQEVFSARILICTDSVFPELKVQNVQNMIHYSMPTSWTRFTARFAALAQTYENYVSMDFDCHNEVPAHSMILLDEDNSIQLPRLIDFMKKHDQLRYIHSDILAVSKRVLVEREEKRICKGTLMCPFVLEFGECDEPHCDYRHDLTRFDLVSKRDGIPMSGEIEILILKVFSPTHYAARLLKHKPLNSSKWIEARRSQEVCKFGMQLNLFYLDRDNWIIHWPLKLNDLCIYKVNDTFQRVRLLEIPDVPNLDVIRTLKVTIKLIDIGTVISAAKSDELLVCADQFKSFPAQAIDIRLMGVVPFDNERTWDSKATKSVQKWIVSDLGKNHCVRASVNFALAQTVFVNSIIVLEYLPTVDKYNYYTVLKRSLVGKNFALFNTEERSSVRDIAEEFGLLLAEDSDTDKGFESCNNESSNLIQFSSNDNTLDSENLKLKPTEEDNAMLKALKNKPINGNEEKNEENWDNLTEEIDKNEVYLPLTSSAKDTIHEKYVISECVAPKESWCRLPLHKLSLVEIGDERENGNWHDMYLQCIDKFSMRKFIELRDVISEHIENVKNQPVERFSDDWFHPMQNCVVKYDNLYVRAKIHAVLGDSMSEPTYRFFVCDYACFVTVNAADIYDDFLYPTTAKIIEFTPYQAVHCTLAGIQVDRFAKRHKVSQEYLFAYAVADRMGSDSKVNDLDIQSFEILLYESEHEDSLVGAEMLNKTLLTHGIAAVNAEAKHYLDLDVSLDLVDCDDTATDVDDSQVVKFEELLGSIQRHFELVAEELAEENDFDDDKAKSTLRETKAICTAACEKQRELLEENQYTLGNLLSTEPNAKESGTQTVAKSKSTGPKLAHIETKGGAKKTDTDRGRANLCYESDEELLVSSTSDNTSDVVSSSISQFSDDASADQAPPPPLIALHKRPQTTWYDTECLIILLIHAPDIDDYFLEVTKDTLLFTAIAKGEEFAMVLNLLGLVEPNMVSHEIRGLNVVVRLVKSIFMKWPRLLQQSTKLSWLTYNFNAIDTVEQEQLQPQQHLQLATVDAQRHFAAGNVNGYDSEDSEDSERNLYQTYTPIINSEDIHDPTAEI